jgi:hypothetical protein
LSGLNSIRQRLDSLSRLSGFDRQGTHVNVAVQSQLNFGLETDRRAGDLKIRSRTGTESANRASPCWRSTISKLRELAYQIDPALWVREALGVEPAPGRPTSCARRAGPRSSPSRQVGKTTTRRMGDRA